MGHDCDTQCADTIVVLTVRGMIVVFKVEMIMILNTHGNIIVTLMGDMIVVLTGRLVILRGHHRNTLP